MSYGTHPLISADMSFFHRKSATLIKVVAIFMMSAKFQATLGLLKIKVFRDKGYDVINSVDDVIKKFYRVTQIIL